MESVATPDYYSSSRRVDSVGRGVIPGCNYISWFGRAVRLETDKTVTVDRNLIVIGEGLTPNVGINTFFSTAAIKVTNNTLLSAFQYFVPISFGDTGVFFENHCDATNPGCADCISAGKCVAIEHPVCP